MLRESALRIKTNMNPIRLAPGKYDRRKGTDFEYGDTGPDVIDVSAGEAQYTTLITCSQPKSAGSLPTNSPSDVIPDGNGGVLATWVEVPGNANGPYPLTIADVGPNGTVQANFSNLNGQGAGDSSLVLGDNNTAFATDGATVVSFNVSTLQQNWAYTSTGGSLSFVAATSGGGLTINDSQLGVIQLDSSGNASAPVASLRAATPLGYTDLFFASLSSSLGGWAGIDNSTTTLSVGPSQNLSSSFAEPLGDPEGGKSTAKYYFALDWCANGSCQDIHDQDVSFTYYQYNPPIRTAQRRA